MSNTTSTTAPAVATTADKSSKFWDVFAAIGKTITRVFAFLLPVLPYIILGALVFGAISLITDRGSLEGAVVVIVTAVLFTASAAILTVLAKNSDKVFAHREKKLRTKPVWWDGHAPLAPSTVATSSTDV